ncbi:hypothetical protein P5673_012304 [Acropora cervicornis]|nr:hypothetical protein P5673_012304 [Acropora cervicornis]
MSVLTRR